MIAKNYERRDAIESTQKGINDYVTNVDKAAEAEIIEIIRKSYPDPQLLRKKQAQLKAKKAK